MKESINEICKNLSDNYLFQASLGSKELFHSNMVAWLLEQPNNEGKLEALQLFGKHVLKHKSFPEIDFNNKKLYSIKREKNNIDITIEWEGIDGRNFSFIENKMKSIPTHEQLEEYNKKIKELYSKVSDDKIHKILLTPLTPSIENTDWEKVTYEDHILKFLTDCKKIKFKNEVNIFLDKYIDIIKNLIRLVDTFQINNNDEFLNRKYNFYSTEIMDPVMKIRLHDFILKLVHDKIRVVIENELAESKGIELWSGFSRQEGITDIKFKVSDFEKKTINYEQYLVIQLQGTNIKYGVEVKYDPKTKNEAIEKNKLFAKNLYQENALWFYDEEKNLKLTGNGRNKEELKYEGKGGNTGVFNSYTDCSFIYLTKKIETPETLHVKDIIDLMLKSTNHIKTNLDKFQEIFKKSK